VSPTALLPVQVLLVEVSATAGNTAPKAHKTKSTHVVEK